MAKVFTRPPLSLFIILGALLICQNMLAPNVPAHAKPQPPVPAIAAEVAMPMEALTLNFSKPVRLIKVVLVPMSLEQLEILTVKSKLDDNAAVALSAALPKRFVKSIPVSFAPLAPGGWGYQWFAIAKDGHNMRGVGHFTVVEP